MSEKPHAVVKVVVLHVEVVPVEGHVEEVGHERDFRDWKEKVPGEEVVDKTTISSAAGESDPAQNKTPGKVVHRVVCSCLVYIIFSWIKPLPSGRVIRGVDKSKGHKSNYDPNKYVDQSVHSELLVLGDVK